ncbi:antitoxin VbhA family protein [Curtobacterium sp. MCBD17_040]|uniref:antitoxin VbhA family protein n=1 Tax=Curtobacterium sp. MCBD17_040 TaxID=2175674 RepID=UPI0015E8D025
MTGSSLESAERERRLRAVSAVIHSGRLEGAKDDREWQSMLYRFANGEITRDQLREFAHRR